MDFYAIKNMQIGGGERLRERGRLKENWAKEMRRKVDNNLYLEFFFFELLNDWKT